MKLRSGVLMPLVFFMAPNDPRMISTVDAIRKQLDVGGLAADGLVYPYDPAAAPDGPPGSEGTFNMCSFRLVEAPIRAGRTDPTRLDDARLLFEQMLGYGDHLASMESRLALVARRWEIFLRHLPTLH